MVKSSFFKKIVFFADFFENSLNIFAEIYKLTYTFSVTEFETCECSGFFHCSIYRGVLGQKIINMKFNTRNSIPEIQYQQSVK